MFLERFPFETATMKVQRMCRNSGDFFKVLSGNYLYRRKGIGDGTSCALVNQLYA
jgi:hypothetical protein